MLEYMYTLYTNGNIQICFVHFDRIFLSHLKFHDSLLPNYTRDTFTKCTIAFVFFRIGNLKIFFVVFVLLIYTDNYFNAYFGYSQIHAFPLAAFVCCHRNDPKHVSAELYSSVVMVSDLLQPKQW